MARPSQNIDKKLIELGKKRMFEHGVSNLSIRSICMDSGINLGMFHYYFKSKENFIRILFKSLNEDLQNYWKAYSADAKTSKEKLKKVLFLNAKLMREQRGVFETLVKDLDFYDDFYIQLGKEMHRLWKVFFIDLMTECKQDGYIDRSIDTDMLLSVLVGSVMNYGKQLLEHSDVSAEVYYSGIQELIDLLMEKFK